MIILLFFAFLAGFVTIFAPCIWPLLPIVLSASSAEGKKRPLGLTLGVMTSFAVFTLSISYLEKFLHLNANVFRAFAVIVIGLLGLSMLIPALGARFEVFINDLLRPLSVRQKATDFSPWMNGKGLLAQDSAPRALARGAPQKNTKNKDNGFAGGFGAGISIGLVWAPCAGPILATVATLAATQAVDIKVVLVTLAYVAGLGIPLFLITLAGSLWFGRMRKANRFTGMVQQIFGLLMIAAAVLIYTNYDKVLQVKILNLFPSYGNIFSSIENNEQVAKQLKILRKDEDNPVVGQSGQGILPDLGPAPDFAGINHWLNTPGPLTLADLKGKVVLVDFWTYSCVNCVRTLPYVTGWYEKYKGNDFIVIGVHAPEFAFEKDTANVENALKQFNIHFPVAQDNDFATWRNYRNRYWPAKYLIDAKGRLRFTHFGEGEYEKTEMMIRALLAEAGQKPDNSSNIAEAAGGNYEKTPETYLGLARMERFDSPQKGQKGDMKYTLPEYIDTDHFAYEGNWTLENERAVTSAGSALELHFEAGKVFLVIGPKEKGGRVMVYLDGKLVNDSQAGRDVKNGAVILDTERLYELIDLRGQNGEHELRLEFPDKGVAVYAFTFG